MPELTGRLAAIHLAMARGLPMRTVEQAVAVAGEGLIGDRYQAGIGTFSSRFEIVSGARALSLLDSDSLRRCGERLGRVFSSAELRRNLLIDGLDLMALRGHTLRIGEVRIELVGSCPPCAYLSRLLQADMRCGLRAIGGMRARILVGGVIRSGMPATLEIPRTTHR